MSAINTILSNADFRYYEETIKICLSDLTEDRLGIIANRRPSDLNVLFTMANAVRSIDNKKFLEIIFERYYERGGINCVNILVSTILKYNISEDILTELTDKIFDAETLACICNGIDKYNIEQIRVLCIHARLDVERIKVIKKAFDEGLSVKHVRMFAEKF